MVVSRFYFEASARWRNEQDLESKSFMCSFCGSVVSSVKGYKLGQKTYPGNSNDGSGIQIGAIYICPGCGGPIFFLGNRQSPSPKLGSSVRHVPEELNKLYEEARDCTGQGCYTGAVLLCRKMLMNIAVQKSAEEGMKFIEYVNFLCEVGYVPPNGKGWVDHIRNKGNEATHEISLMGEQDARELLTFTEMLLRFIYEFPCSIPQTA